MNKQQLAAEIARRVEASDIAVTTAQVTAVLNVFLSTVVDTVASGEEVQVFGFGKFERVHRPARDARNVATGEPIRVPAKDVPKFTPGSDFKAVVANGGKKAVAA